MKTNSILIMVIVGICIINTSCYKKGYTNDSSSGDSGSTIIIGTGDVVEKNIDVASFSKINLVGNASITVKKGIAQSITIKAQQNILDVLKCEVVNKQLEVGFIHGYKVKVSKVISIDIVTTTILTDVTMTGTGKIDVSSNKQDLFNISIVGSGDIDAKDLEVDNCSISIAGAGNCKVQVAKKLKVNIAGVGSVYYKGHPEIVQSIAGVGSIIDNN